MNFAMKRVISWHRLPNGDDTITFVSTMNCNASGNVQHHYLKKKTHGKISIWLCLFVKQTRISSSKNNRTESGVCKYFNQFFPKNRILHRFFEVFALTQCKQMPFLSPIRSGRWENWLQRNDFSALFIKVFDLKLFLWKHRRANIA